MYILSKKCDKQANILHENVEKIELRKESKLKKEMSHIQKLI